MTKAAYVGVDGVARKIKKGYVGIENFTKRALPSGYTQVGYIESTGTQYIDTGVKATAENFRIKCRFTITSITDSTVLFGGGASTDLISAMIRTNPDLRFYVGGGSVSAADVTIARGVEYEMDCHANNGTFTVVFNGGTYSGSYSSTINKDYPLFLFANNVSGTASQFAKARFKMFQIYDNGTLVRDYVPCKNSSGVVGLFDVVNSKFYTNAGSGTFDVGSSAPIVARKIKKAYVGVNGVARLFYSGAFEVLYTGTYTDQIVTMTDGTYRLLTLTGSGTLTLSDATECDIWMCGGGANGGAASGATGVARAGGGGGYVLHRTGVTLEKETVVIGTGGGGSTTVTGTETLTANGASRGNGGTGGGEGAASSSNETSGGAGTGAGVTTAPFGGKYVSEYWCAGGGGGGYYKKDQTNGTHGGGDGGSNGSNGSARVRNTRTATSGGATGGGDGGSNESLGSRNGGDASTYGSGGGGAAYYYTSSNKSGDAGAGYQGVVLIRIPYVEEE